MYYIIASGYNCLDYAKRCFSSMQRLIFNPTKFKIVYASDGSTDGTSEWLTSEVKGKSKHELVWINEQNMGATYTRHAIIKSLNLKDEDVIILIGLDDEILPNALAKIDAQYRKGKWMTYGNWVDQYGKMLPRDFPLDFDEQTHTSRDYRKVVYRSTGLNTFKYFLYKEIPEEDLKINGQWINSTTESEIMFSCLEMCGKYHIGIIYEAIAIYNRNLPNGSLKRLGRKHKYELLDIIKARPKRKQLIRATIIDEN